MLKSSDKMPNGIKIVWVYKNICTANPLKLKIVVEVLTCETFIQWNKLRQESDV